MSWIFSKPDFGVGILRYATPQVNFYNGDTSHPGSPGDTKGGDSKPILGTGTKKTTDVVSVTPDQAFECYGRGLRPDTKHRFFYENVDRTADCKQILEKGVTYAVETGKLGGPLITDENGKVKFIFYFTPRVEQEVDKLNKVNYNLVGDKVFELRATDSTAKKVVPFTQENIYKEVTKKDSYTQVNANPFGGAVEGGYGGKSSK